MYTFIQHQFLPITMIARLLVCREASIHVVKLRTNIPSFKVFLAFEDH